MPIFINTTPASNTFLFFCFFERLMFYMNFFVLLVHRKNYFTSTSLEVSFQLCLSRLPVQFQIEQQDQILTKLQQDLKCECQRQQEMSRQVQTSKKTIAELQDEIDGYQKRERDGATKLRERDASLSRLRQENENALARMRGMKEEIAEKDGQLRVAKMNKEVSEKQNQQHQQEVRSSPRQLL